NDGPPPARAANLRNGDFAPSFTARLRNDGPAIDRRRAIETARRRRDRVYRPRPNYGRAAQADGRRRDRVYRPRPNYGRAAQAGGRRRQARSDAFGPRRSSNTGDRTSANIGRPAADKACRTRQASGSREETVPRR